MTNEFDRKNYPEALYRGKQFSDSGGQPVYKKLLPDGETTGLPLGPSLKLYDHSPDGFRWGYGGSAPAQLALALLLDATTIPETALAYYQQFKDDKVAVWGNEWEISRSEILQWIAEEQARELAAMASRN